MWTLDKGTRVPVLTWADPLTLEEDTLRQITDLANLPFAFHHVALMADAHVGYGMPIGGILASQDYIVPNAVGVDIGCGMVAVETSMKREEFIEKREEIGHEITRSIPTGFHKHKKPQEHEFLNKFPKLEVISPEIRNIKRQLGTLGGGNHFIDIHIDEKDTIWLMVHSGSRNIGKKIADYYHNKAKEFTASKFRKYPSIDLAALPVGSKYGKEYITGMQFAQDYALTNRQRMLEIIKSVIDRFIPGVEYKKEVNIHHNYASHEKHFGEMVWIHRKGATSAKEGEFGIVPGSMATSSYITKGLGNTDSFNSAPHGAGRRLGRKEAKRRYSIQDVHKELDEKDIKLYSVKNAGAIEEHSQSYKDIDEIMHLQTDLVEVVTKLKPILVIIG